MTPDTGQLATAVFEGDVDFEARMTMIGELNRKVEKLAADALDTEDEHEFVPGDLVDPGELEVEFYFDGTQAIPEPGGKSVVTVTLPLGEGQSAPASWTASGFFLEKILPSAQTGTLMKAKAKFALDGRGTKFTYTPATPAA